MSYIYLRSQDIRSENGYSSPEYHVPVYRLMHIREGVGQFCFNDKTIQVKACDFLLNTPGYRSIEFPPGQNVHIHNVTFTAPDHWLNKSTVEFTERGRLYNFLVSIMEDLIIGPRQNGRWVPTTTTSLR